jgi:uncharacterized protein (TIGR04222 family)
MGHDHVQLRQRLEAFSFDEPGAKLPFSARLARDNLWSPDYTRRVLEEYKRFALLAVVAGHPVTPSDQVDQAWHLHLVYTESYWREFCGEVLGQPLHHGPTRGGGPQRRKYRSDYELTLASYRAFFGAEPPPDIWPDPDRRFGHDLAFARINTADHWVIRKPRWSPRPVWLALTLGLVGCASALSPFDLKGGEFLRLFTLVWIGAVAAAWLTRRLIRSREADTIMPSLDSYEIAHLSGGETAAVLTAVASLVSRRALELDPGTRQLRKSSAKGVGGHSMEQAVYDGLKGALDLTQIPVDTVTSAASAPLAEIRTKLDSLGLTTSRTSRAPLWIALSAPILGAIKVVVGISRDKPVGYLVVLCVVASVLAWLLFRPRPGRTPRGDRMLADLRAQNHGLRPAQAGASLDPGSLPLAVALFGLPVLAQSEFPLLEQALAGVARRRESDWSSSHAADWGGGDAAFGAGGGDGGCGGGGCGGCGGGCGGCGG